MKNFSVYIFSILSLLFSQDNLQVNQAKKMIKDSGLPSSQVKIIAKQKGVPDNTIKKILSSEPGLGTISTTPNDNFELPKPLPLESSNTISEKFDDKKNENSKNELSETLITSDIINGADSKKEKSTSELFNKPLKYFGYETFKRDPSIFQSSAVGVVDPDYLIGPGDEIIMMLWGETQFRQLLKVDREGFVFIPEIGQVFVNGLNLNLLESKLFRVLSQSYASLNPQGQKATTFLDISLGNLRPLRIQVIGEVSQPGGYTVSPSATLFSSLYYFKGPTTLGSLRDIRLIRNENQIISIDFYDYLLTGKKLKDEKLQLDDVVFIPQRGKTISIDGEVNRPGIYELKPSETLKDLLSIAGGVKASAYLNRAIIDRIVPFEERAAKGMDRMFTDVNLDSTLNTATKVYLQDRDKIHIFSVMEMRQNAIKIEGAVSRPGVYTLDEGLTLKGLIIKADSLLGDAYLERVDVIRLKSDLSQELIKLNLRKVLDEDIDNNILLQGSDEVKVYGMTKMVPNTYVSIDGHVKNPGKYLLQKNMTLYDLIFLREVL